MRPEELRQAGYETWEAIVPTWERQRDFVETIGAPVRQWLVRELAPQTGQTILELAAGLGETGFDAAALVGKGGRLISTDFSPAMVEAGRRRGAQLGVENVEHRVMDAEQLELDDDSVDGVVCRFGFMLMVDPAAALAEARRVLRPGGRLAFAVWGPPERNPCFAVAGRILTEGGHMPPPEPGAPGIFALAAEDRIRELLEGAGFADARLEEVPVRFPFADVAAYLATLADTAGPIAMALRTLSEDERAQLQAALEKAFSPFSSDDGYQVPGVALCAVAS